jgi:hypothetical protein
MKRLGIISIAILFFLGVCGAERVAAQAYRFSIPKANVTITIEDDGSALIDYELTFTCMPGAHAIDIVDISMPNLDKHEPVRASINGHSIPLHRIEISSVLKPHGSGYEIPLGSQTILPGKTGVFRFSARERRMVYQDTTNREQASFRFTPTWFDSQYIIEDTALTMRYKLPIPEEDYSSVKDRILWQKEGEDFSLKGVLEGEDVVSVVWKRKVRLAGENVFGVSFPKNYVERVRKDSVWQVFYRWFSGNLAARIYGSLIILVAFGVIFFIATRKTGLLVFFVLAGLMLAIMIKWPVFQLLLFPIVLLLGIWLALAIRARKKRYFPASVCREGGGLKRGLTAVEAAVLLELPLSKVLTMIIFGMTKKGLIKIESAEPLKVQICGTETQPNVWQLPDEKKRVEARDYESAFLRVFLKHQGRPVDGMNLSQPFDHLIKYLGTIMGGFDLKQTREYYRLIVSRAWKLVKAEADYEARYVRANQSLEWLMLDKNWEDDLHDLGGGRYRYHPWWWYGGSRNTYSRPMPSMPSGSGGASETSAPGTSFGDVVNSFTGKMESVCTKAAESLDGLGTTDKGVIDFSRFDRFTKETLADFASQISEGGGSGSGFSGGGCACACAGCACACACAGGGR